MNSLKPTIGLLAATLLWTGCTTAQVNWSLVMPTPLEPHDAVAIVAQRQAEGDEDISFATEATGCIAAALRDTNHALKIVRTDEFYRTAFPDVCLDLAPGALINLPLLLKDPAFREKIAPLGLRYLISVQGKTDQQAKPIIGLVGGPTAAVTVLGAGWDRRSNVTASVLDLQQGQSGAVWARADGKPWFVCIGLGPLCAPLGAPAFTEAKACDEIGKGVAKFLAGESAAQVEDAPRTE